MVETHHFVYIIFPCNQVCKVVIQGGSWYQLVPNFQNPSEHNWQSQSVRVWWETVTDMLGKSPTRSLEDNQKMASELHSWRHHTAPLSVALRSIAPICCSHWCPTFEPPFAAIAFVPHGDRAHSGLDVPWHLSSEGRTGSETTTINWYKLHKLDEPKGCKYPEGKSSSKFQFQWSEIWR
jgi:hypothetical protein